MQPATSFFKNILRFGPGGLILSAAVLLSLQAILVSKYYSDMFPAHVWNGTWCTWLAGISSGALKMLAFFLLFLTVKNFSDGKRYIGKWGLAATAVLNLYFLLECHFMAALWSGNSEGYWHLLPFLTTITVMVLFVEWRLAATTSAAAIEETALATSETTIADLRNQLADVTGKLNLLQAEKDEAENRKRQAEEAAQHLEAQAREQEIAAVFAENEQLRKKVAVMERRAENAGGAPVKKGDRLRIERNVKEFYRKNGFAPNQQQAANLSGLKDAKSVRLAFPNGSWEAFISQLQEETQPETTEAILTTDN